MSTRTRRLPVLIALALCIGLIGASCTKNNDAFQAATFINDSRAASGLPSLQFDQRLIDKAQAWAEVMAANGSVSHSNLSDGTGSGWRRLGENVGFAYSVEEAHRLFMASSSHRGSILSRNYTKFGTGVAVSDGKYYLVQVFGA